MITLQQDSDGYIKMTRHFPERMPVSISFTDGSTQEFTGRRLNGLYDQAVAEYRALNRLDAKGFSRRPTTTVQPSNAIEFVAVHPGMGE
jgi:hypothetical protein